MKKDIVIFDLDGTLADIHHRLHHIEKEPQDWASFFAACDKDRLIESVAAFFFLVRRNPSYEVWIVTGRSDEVIEQTRYWLLNHHLNPDKLIMRPAGNYEADDVLKVSWVTEGIIPKDRVLAVFEDRSKVVNAWRKAGLPCFQVANGEF